MYVPTEGVLQELMAERDRQIAKGYTIAHDDQHTDGTILQAAEEIIHTIQHDRRDVRDQWPHVVRDHAREKYDTRQRLIIAAAMLVAEIERIDRNK